MEKNQFAESSGYFPLISNPGIGTFDRYFLCVSVPSQGLCAGLWGNGCWPFLSDSFGGSRFKVSPLFSLVWWAIWCRQVLWSSPARRLVCEQSLVPSAHRASYNWTFQSLTFHLTTDSPGWSNMLLISASLSCVAPQLIRLWSLSPFLYKLGQFSIVPCPHSW
jgi:hypothetical protein